MASDGGSMNHQWTFTDDGRHLTLPPSGLTQQTVPSSGRERARSTLASACLRFMWPMRRNVAHMQRGQPKPAAKPNKMACL
jgi:hypothetical protein